MSFNKKFFTTGGIVASTPSAAAFDPLQNFETVTYTGNGSTQKITGYIRKGAAFNGSSSKIDIPAITPSNLKSVSFWINSSDTGANKQIFSMGKVGVYNWLSIRLNAGKIEAGYGSDNGAYLSGSAITTNSTFNDGDWHHVVCTFTGTYGTSQAPNIYVDGSDVATTALSSSGNAISSPSGTGAIGYYGAQNILYINGKIDQVRIFNTALNSTQVGQLAAEDYTDPKKSTTDYFGNGSGIALYEFEEGANSSNFGQAAVYNGSSSKIILPNSTSIAPQNNFTFSAWFNTSTLGVTQTIYAFNSPSTYQSAVFIHSNGTNNIRVFSAGLNYYSSNNIYQANQWYHLVVTKSSTSGIVAYLDGVEIINEPTATANNTQPPDGDNRIGGYKTAAESAWFNGKIDQVRIYSSALDSTDVEKLYKESADVPTATLVAHYKLDGDAEDVLDTYDGTASNVTYSAGVYGGTPTNINFLGMAFQPDLVWIKKRSGTAALASHILHDSVRGATYSLYSDLTNQQGNTNAISSFDSNGFTIGTSYDGTNGSGNNIVAWCWKAGGSVTPNNNTNGTITSTVSANQDAGFSIVKYTGSGANATVGHGLSSAPELIIVKGLSTTYDWVVYNSNNGATKYQTLNSTIAATSASSVWNNTEPTSSVFSVGSNLATNQSNDPKIAYCFHSVDGYSRISSYVGNDTTNTIYVGFKPRFLLIKCSSNGGTNKEWVMIDSTMDPSTPITKRLEANTSDAEATDTINVTMNNDGWTMPNGTSTASINQIGFSYVFLAIA